MTHKRAIQQGEIPPRGLYDGRRTKWGKKGFQVAIGGELCTNNNRNEEGNNSNNLIICLCSLALPSLLMAS